MSLELEQISQNDIQSSSYETIFESLQNTKLDLEQKAVFEKVFEKLIEEFGSDIDQSLQQLLQDYLNNENVSQKLRYFSLFSLLKQKLLYLDKYDTLEIKVYDSGNVREKEVNIAEEVVKTEEEDKKLEKQNIEIGKEYTDKLKEILHNFELTEAAYQNLSTDLKAEVEAKIQDSHYSSYKKTLAQELKSQGIEDPNYVDQYLRYYILEQEFAEKLAQEPHAQEFKSSYEKLQKSIGLSVATLHRSDPESISRFIVDHFDIQKREMPEFLSSQGLLDDQFDNYLTEKEKDALKKKIEECPSTQLIALLKLEQSYALDPKDLDTYLKTFSEAERAWLKLYIDQYNGIKDVMFKRLEKSKNTLWYQLMAAPLLGMSSYLDTSIAEQNLAENFLTLRQKTDIQKRGENLSIRGEIFAQQVVLMQNEQNQLMVKDALSRDPDKGFEQNNKYLDLKVKLPSTFLLEEQSKKRCEKNLSRMMQSESDWKNLVVHELGAELLQMYQPYQLFVKNRLSKQLQRTVSKQDLWDTLQTFGGNVALSEYNTQLAKDHPNSKILQNRIKMTNQLPAESAHLLSDQLKRFRNLMQSSDVEKMKFTHQSDKIFGKLDAQQNDPPVDKIANLKDVENPLFQFLGLFIWSTGGEKTLLLQDMKNYLDLIESGDDIGENIVSKELFSAKFKTNYEKIQKTNSDEDQEKNLLSQLEEIEDSIYSYA